MIIQFERVLMFGVLFLTACAAGGVDQSDLAYPPALPPTDEERVRDAAEEARMEDYVASHVLPEDVVTQAVLPGGDVVDCVKAERQPTLRRPEMAGQALLTHPAELPDGFVPTAAGPGEELVPVPEEGSVCPAGTVPILPVEMETLRRFETIEDFRAKIPSHLRDDEEGPLGATLGEGDLEAPRVGSSSTHQYAHAYRVVDNYGLDAYFNVWTPYVELGSEFSLSQMWVYRGSGASLETVEAGWQVYSDLYGDSNPHLFIYFTPDNYGSGGCYNTSCTGWVQTSGTVTPGMTLSPTSTSGGTQYTFRLTWYRDSSGNWWLYYQSGWVGYYPRSLFDSNGLYNKASTVDLGGEVVDGNSARHTYTDMGSGAFPSSGYTYAAYDRNVQYVSTAGAYTALSGLTATRTDSYCYDVTTGYSAASWKYYLYFGGSGYNSNCT